MTPDVTGTYTEAGTFDPGDGTGPHPYFFNEAAGYYLWAVWGSWIVVNQPPHIGTIVSPATWDKGPGYGDPETGMLGSYSPGAGATGELTFSK